MFFSSHIKPKYRSNFRHALGKKYFIAKRYIMWLFGGIKFAEKRDTLLPHEHCAHATPLFRKLQHIAFASSNLAAIKDVDIKLQENKVVNLRIAVKKLNLVTLYPNETFSFWKLIGKPTKRKGYKEGMVLKSGQVTAATGGGMCQLSNLIYWLTIHTPLTITERHRHGYDVFPDANRTQPFGSGATCFYNYGDLMIKNETADIFQLHLNVTERELKGAWKCDIPPIHNYEVYESEHLMKSEYWGGHTRRNVIRRKKFSLCGDLLDDEFVVENCAIMMYSPFIAEKK